MIDPVTISTLLNTALKTLKTLKDTYTSGVSMYACVEPLKGLLDTVEVCLKGINPDSAATKCDDAVLSTS